MRNQFVFVLGRAIFGGFFVHSGLRHFQQQKMMSQYAASKGVPAPDLAVAGSGALAIAGGLSVLAGAKPREGLAALVAFLVPVTLKMHRFWEAQDPQEQMHETVNFMKNMALTGAALMMMTVPEPWPASIDELRTEEDMYLHLEGRERLRQLA
jgi:putative oxidoreductase